MAEQVYDATLLHKHAHPTNTNVSTYPYTFHE